MESLRSVIIKMDRSTQKLTTGRIHLFDIRPARNALKGLSNFFLALDLKLNDKVNPTPYARAGGCWAFNAYSPPEADSMFISFFYRSNWPLFRPEAALKTET